MPAANCNSTIPGGGWSSTTSNFAPQCRAGTNNLGGAMQCVPSSGTCAAQFMVELPTDWDTTQQPFISIIYASGANTTGTVIWTVGTACSKEDGSVTDDPGFHAESSYGPQTMAAANRNWSQKGQLTAVTSGNGCIGGSPMIVDLVLTGTANLVINAYQAVVTIPRVPVVQAN